MSAAPHAAREDAPPAGRLARWLRRVLGLYLGSLRLFSRRRARPARVPAEVLLTGTFHSRNWVLAHVRPLVQSEACRRLTVVSTHPPLDLPKLEWKVPPRWLQRLAGEAPARLLVFAWLAVWRRPDYLGGFHLLFNGLAAIWLAKLLRRRSVYFCVGGPAEVERGGLWSENKVFSRLPQADYRIERQLLEAVGHADLVVTMGTSAASFYRERARPGHLMVHPGGLDLSTCDTDAERDIDVLFVGRLAPIKRLDLFVDVIGALARERPGVRAAIVGEGPERASVLERVAELGLEENVALPGFQSDVRGWLCRSRALLMTSDTEGLSLAVMEAMACGVPAVVRDVGDLGNLVEDGVTGFLIRSDAPPEQFAARLAALLGEPGEWRRFSAAALDAVAGLEMGAAAERWTRMLAELGAAPDWV